MGLRIAEAAATDAALVHRLMRAAFAEYEGALDPPSGALSESVADVARAMAEGGALIAWLGEEAVGAARYRRRPDRLYVERVSVLPAHRQRGIGVALMRAAEPIAARLGYHQIEVGVRTALPSNVALYQRLGYEIVSIQPHPRNPANDTATLVKRLG